MVNSSEHIHDVFLLMCVCERAGCVVHARVCVQEYLTELQALLQSVAETDFKLNSPEFWPAAFYNLPQQELCLKVSTARLSEKRRVQFPSESGEKMSQKQAKMMLADA